MLEGNIYSSLRKSPSMEGGLLVVTSLAFICLLDDPVPGWEATDLTGKFGKNKQSSCGLLPHVRELPVRAQLGGGSVYHIHLL